MPSRRILRKMSKRVLVGALLGALAAAAALAAPACYWVDYGDLGSNCAPGTPEECCPCPWPEDCPDGAPPLPPSCNDAGADGDANDEQSACSQGICVTPPEDWEPVVLTSNQVDLPACPEAAPEIVFDGQLAPEAAPVCAACSCDPPVGSCSLPTTWTISSAPCANPGGGVKTNFDPPVNWDGSCTTFGAVPAGKLCGGVPCVASVTVMPPMVEEQPCMPRGGDPMPAAPRLVAEGPFWTFGRACARTPWPACAGGELCLPSSSSPFATCVMHAGEMSCPDGWPDRHLLYGQVDDQRTCTECSCSLPTGAKCTVLATMYKDGACGTLVGAVTSSTDMAFGCVDVGAGSPIGSRSVPQSFYEPGTCESSGGEVVGELILADARTFCCLGPAVT